MNINILGAGLSGLMAGFAFQKSTIYERNKKGTVNHSAVLRFRSPNVGEFLGIPFKRVKVNKGIFTDYKFVKPNIRICNMYSRKVTGLVLDRSIWNIEPVERWIAPNNITEILQDWLNDKIVWDFDYNEIKSLTNEKTINTIPLPVICSILGIDHNVLQNDYSRVKKIYTLTGNLKGYNVNQTIYFPDPSIRLYRASIVGEKIIMEFIDDESIEAEGVDQCCVAFGILPSELNTFELAEKHQEIGKIVSSIDSERKEIIYNLSVKHNIFSLGRYATWRNILLDDVLKDIDVIKRLINSTNYDISLHNNKL